MNIVLLHEALHKRLLYHAQIGSHKLEDLRGPLASHEERRLGVLVRLGRALVHGPLSAGILGFSTRPALASHMQCSQSIGRLTLVAACLRTSWANILRPNFFSQCRDASAAAKRKPGPGAGGAGAGQNTGICLHPENGVRRHILKLFSWRFTTCLLE